MVAAVGAAVLLLDGLDRDAATAELEDIVRPSRSRPFQAGHALGTGDDQLGHAPGLAALEVERLALVETADGQASDLVELLGEDHRQCSESRKMTTRCCGL